VSIFWRRGRWGSIKVALPQYLLQRTNVGNFALLHHRSVESQGSGREEGAKACTGKGDEIVLKDLRMRCAVAEVASALPGAITRLPGLAGVLFTFFRGAIGGGQEGGGGQRE